ncbi:MAG: aconitate hydratase AcnA [Flavobacteriales bacterium]|nr:MAG: aconitate hydratase AcnA [Flavobacteriales bacterium]
MENNDIFNIVKELSGPSGKLRYYSLKQLEANGHRVSHLPYSIRILLENALRNYDDFGVTKENIKTLLGWKPEASDKDIPFKPARVLMQDFTGVPAVVDLAAIRSEVNRRGKSADSINPLIPVDLVIDHSVNVDHFGTKDAHKQNVALEYERNGERYQLLKWAQKSFKNFGVVPPGMGICHQVNLEYLASGVIARDGLAFPDTLVGTDSHTPMVNGIGVIAWGVGGIEAEAAILGQPIYFIMPEVVGLKLTGKLPTGATATDMVLTITEMLRKHGVVGKFVEVYGTGLDNLSVPDRATISNMSPEFGCTVTYFPIDDRTLDYMRNTNRNDGTVRLVEDYCKANLLWRDDNANIKYSSVVELDLSTVVPTVSGPKRPQDKILVTEFKDKFEGLLNDFGRSYIKPQERQVGRWKNEGGSVTDTATLEKELRSIKVEGENNEYNLSDGSVVIAAITSCTNTSNPSVMIGAGIMARKARALGVDVKPWVKTSLAPGSKVVTDYLENAGLLEDLEALSFHVVGYGCTSCIGNSGPLPPQIAKAVEDNDLIVSSVLSGNRNFEARVHPQVKMNFLMSPILVVAYAIAGRVDIDINNEPIATDKDGNDVYLKDIWPALDEIETIMKQVLGPKDFAKSYGTIYDGDEQWQQLQAPTGSIFAWDSNSTYIKEAPFFKNLSEEVDDASDIKNARTLLWLGDSVTTDHISPAGAFGEASAAGKYLMNRGVERKDFNSYGSRRGNDEVMVRGTFANVRIKNKIANREGGYSVHLPSGEDGTVFDVAVKYKADNTPLIVLAGKEYGSGSSRDWAAKGTFLLGIKAVIAESYERIHRSNLVGMGVLPLQFPEGENAESLGLTGKEVFDIEGINEGLLPLKTLRVTARKEDGSAITFDALCRLDSQIEIAYYQNGGILQYVLRQFLKN